jgi:hypothetical protein
MLFAPQDGQLVPRQFEPAPPRAEWLAVWQRARMLAEEYWSRVTKDPGISRDFQQLTARAQGLLQAIPRRAAPIPAR